MNNDTKVEIIPDKIQTALVQENITEQVIQKLKADYLGLKLNDLNDTEALQRISTARKECKRIRIIAEKICKAGRESAIQEQKLWIAKEKQVTSEILLVENHLASEEEKPEKEKERLRIEQEEKDAARNQERIDLLIQNGMTFNSVAFFMTGTSGITITLAELKNISDTQFDEFLSTVKTENEKQIAQKKKAADDAFALAQENARVRKEQDAIAEQQRKEREEIEKQQEELVRQREIARKNILRSIGMAETEYDWFQYKSIKVPFFGLDEFTDEQFHKEVEQLKSRITALNIQLKAAEEKRIADLAELKLKEEQTRKENEEKERLRKEALAPDKDKLKILSQGLFDFPLPDVQSPEAKLIIKKVNDELAILIEHIDIAINNLK